MNYNFPFSLFVELHAGNPHSKNARLNMLMGVYVVGPDYRDADPFMLLDGTVPSNTTVPYCMRDDDYAGRIVPTTWH